MMVSTTDILNLLRAKPGRFIEDIAGDEFPMREGDDSLVVISVNDRDFGHISLRFRAGQFDRVVVGCDSPN
jgi:hypothetical protein